MQVVHSPALRGAA